MKAHLSSFIVRHFGGFRFVKRLARFLGFLSGFFPYLDKLFHQKPGAAVEARYVSRAFKTNLILSMKLTSTIYQEGTQGVCQIHVKSAPE